MRNTSAGKKSTPQEESTSNEDRGRKLPKKISESYLFNSGKFYLERFPASTTQFRRVMTRKIHRSCAAHHDPQEEVCLGWLETLIRQFETAGYLNDMAYARGLAYSLQQRAFSRQRIVQTLKMKGLSSEAIEFALPELESRDEFIQALKWVQKKRLGPYSTRENSYNRALSSLARAGYDFETARRALALSQTEIEEYLNASH